MSTIFLYCAAIGGTFLVLQFLLLFGVGGDTEVGDGHGHAHGHGDVGHDQSAFLKMISLQTVTTFATFFGLVGLGTENLGWSPFTVAVTATLAGITALWLVGRLMRGLSALHSQGKYELSGGLAHQVGVEIAAAAAQLVVQMGDSQFPLEARSQFLQHVKQDHGIDPTGNGDKDRLARGEKFSRANGLFDG